jgi:hypothetical protein
MSEDKSPKDNPPTGWAAFAVGIGGVLIAVVLRVSGLIPDWSVVVLIAVLALVAVAVHAFPRLEELNLRQLSIRLREVKSAEERIYAKEQSVQELMLTLADLSAMESLNVGRLGPSGKLLDLMRKWRERRLEKILDLVSATPEQKANLQRFVPIYRAIDDAYALDLPAQDRQQAADPHVKKLIDQFQSEVS